jgi:hypothetical protein
VLIAYVDESGDTGLIQLGGSLTYTLGCILIDADQWPRAFEEMLTFRRRLKATFGVPVRAEIKANYLLRNRGAFLQLGLGAGARYIIYRAHMQQLERLHARAFAVVVDKRDSALSPASYFNLAWEGLLQRLERTSTREGATFIVVHDEGENRAVRRWVRKSRRYLTAGSAYGTGSLQFAARLLVDDPVPRQSDASYFVQAADLVAYAAFRAVIEPSPGIARICSSTMWDEIGIATHTVVTSVRQRSKPGIVLRVCSAPA